MEETQKATGEAKANTGALNKRSKKPLLIAAAILSVLLVGLGSYAGYIYASSPVVIREPQLEHYHFRMQIVVNGQAENFATSKYQQDYAKDQCTADLPAQPIHFHDNKNQFVHIHWEGITGGLLLKNYGWNYIDGLNDILGYKLDDLKNIKKIGIHGNQLPPVPEDAQFYIYTGDKDNYQEKNFNDFLKQDLEEFFGVTSNFPAHQTNKKRSGLLDRFFPAAYAHGTEVHTNNEEAASKIESPDEKLTRINNLIGNTVIFAQKDKPSSQQIKDRFNSLEPLSESTCGG